MKKILLILVLFFSINIFADVGNVRFHNETDNYILNISYKISGLDDWKIVKLNPRKDSGGILTVKKGLGSADIADMVVSIFGAQDYAPIDIGLWSTNISIENGKTTEVYFTMKNDDKIEIDKRLNNKLILARKVVIKDKVKEDYLQHYGAISKLTHLNILADSLFNGSFKHINKSIDLDKWELPDPSLSLDKITLLASHNSFSSYAYGYRFYNQQYYSLEKQFDMGVRCFLLDCYPTEPGKNVHIKRSERPVEVKLCHGECKLGPILRFDGEFSLINFIKRAYDTFKTDKYQKYVTMTFQESLRILKSLLDKNPNEILCIELESYIDKESTDKSIIASGIGNMVLKPSDWNIFEKKGEWPTINWMKENGKRVVVWTSGDETDYAFDQFKIQKSNMYGIIDLKDKLYSERSETKKLANPEMRYLFGINLFPGELLERASHFISEGIKKIDWSKKDWSDLSKLNWRNAESEFIKAFRNVKLYFDLDYEVINQDILFKLIKHFYKNGFQGSGFMKGRFPNMINLDQVHLGNSMQIINYLNSTAIEKFHNPNLNINFDDFKFSENKSRFDARRPGFFGINKDFFKQDSNKK